MNEYLYYLKKITETNEVTSTYIAHPLFPTVFFPTLIHCDSRNLIEFNSQILNLKYVKLNITKALCHHFCNSTHFAIATFPNYGN